MSHQLEAGSYQVRLTIGVGPEGNTLFSHLKSSAFLVLAVVPIPALASSAFFMNIGRSTPHVDITVTITDMDYPNRNRRLPVFMVLLPD